MKLWFSILLALLLVGCGTEQEPESSAGVVRPSLPPALDYSKLNPNTQTYIPILLKQHVQFWPDMQNPSVFTAQIDRETCASQASKQCWQPTARLKTSREEGAGLGQITRAWAANGALRFDSLTELQNKHKDELAGWSWKNVTNALFQLRALVLMNRDNYKVLSGNTEMDRYAFMDAAYNGGLGGVLSEIKLCQNTPNCNPGIWFDNVENTSNKAKLAADGYGQGFFYINRGHVRDVIITRRQRYIEAGLK